MTNKAEDKFYFGKPGQPEKFGSMGWTTIAAYVQVLAEEYGTPRGRQAAEAMMRAAESLGGDAPAELKYAIRTASTSKNVIDRGRAIGQIEDLIEDARLFSRPGQPERFAKNIPIKSWTRGSTKYEAGIMEDAGRFQPYVNMPESGILLTRSAPTFKTETGARKWLESYMQKMNASRPGQPEKFDASSLDRGSFAEASQSPMLGKLLAAKVMPEGGWRAVQSGSDTLVISFEDADLARDFGRRAATKGYNATSPVQAIGRYWNVEVKNGK